ncbi:hypothetical protein Zm00014a_042467 [Zea mays]|uniref:Uncharacterized protein n=1 Tax=Zea mays TaxID=4577 RepID=A0A3L6G402_MAIZE|nr:hypothetical protein Zm00014a_042467 [Zea mays]
MEKDVATVEAAVAVPGRQLDVRVATLVRMLISKGRAAMLAEALDEFDAICITASACCHCVCPYISLCLLQIVPSVLFVYSLLRIVLTTATERHFSQSRVSIFDYLLKAIFPFRLM